MITATKTTTPVRASRSVRVPRVSIELFSIPLGLAGLASAWSAGTTLMHAPAWVSEVFYAVSALTWTAFTASYVLGIGTRTENLRAELHHSGTGPLTAYVPIIPILLAVHYEQHLPGIGPWAIWPAIALLTILFAVLTAHWLTGELHADALHPGYVMPVATGPFIASIGLTSLGHPNLALTAFGGGVFFWIVIGSVIFARLINGALLTPEALPVHSILVVTPAAAGVAWLVIHDGQVDTMAWFLLGATTMMAATMFALIPAFARAPITMNYWAFLFPAATGANLVTRITHALHTPTADVLSWALLATATFVFAGVVTATLIVTPIRAARTRRAPATPDLKADA